MFNLVSNHKPKGDQPKAIKEIVEKFKKKDELVLLGVTGSGKTFTMANVISSLNKPALIIAPNKTLAAQLYEEMKSYFPDNSVSYFVSYYDYYQPEAYIASTNTYIEKDSSINMEIDKLRHLATSSLLSRKDVIIVASVSCIYGLGSPSQYQGMRIEIKKGENFKRAKLLNELIEIQYRRDDYLLQRGCFKVVGDTIEIQPSYNEDIAYRIEMFDDEIELIYVFDPLTGKIISEEENLFIYPASHFAVSKEVIRKAIEKIQEELRYRIIELKKEDKFLEAKRLEERTYYDIEMMEELGYCKGIENYSRHLTGRAAGEPPPTLFDYFPKDFLLFIDESHITIPQINGMYKGDMARKKSLVDYGFRLPSALDNRPLNFYEFEKSLNKVLYVSATPGKYESDKFEKVEQIIRPTGLIDPIIEVRVSKNQIEDLFSEIKKVIVKKEKVLITTLTKKMAEMLTDYYLTEGLRVRYLHSDVPTLERIDIINALRSDEFDVLVGINLLREGLDIPEVSLVAVLDADKEGFLRSSSSLIQVIGRASRNINGKVIMYGDLITDSMKKAIEETNRRREIQIKYNKTNNIKPETIKKNINKVIFTEKTKLEFKNTFEIDKKIDELTILMRERAKDLDFEKAKEYRDEVLRLKMLRLELG